PRQTRSGSHLDAQRPRLVANTSSAAGGHGALVRRRNRYAERPAASCSRALGPHSGLGRASPLAPDGPCQRADGVVRVLALDALAVKTLVRLRAGADRPARDAQDRVDLDHERKRAPPAEADEPKRDPITLYRPVGDTLPHLRDRTRGREPPGARNAAVGDVVTVVVRPRNANRHLSVRLRLRRCRERDRNRDSKRTDENCQQNRFVPHLFLPCWTLNGRDRSTDPRRRLRGFPWRGRRSRENPELAGLP